MAGAGDVRLSARPFLTASPRRPHMHMPSPRRPLPRLRRLAAPTLAALTASFAVAAFLDDATNEGNAATAADVTITEDVPASSPLFDLQDWRPGASDGT